MEYSRIMLNIEPLRNQLREVEEAVSHMSQQVQFPASLFLSLQAISHTIDERDSATGRRP
jgi:hypothetical protein